MSCYGLVRCAVFHRNECNEEVCQDENTDPSVQENTVPVSKAEIAIKFIAVSMKPINSGLGSISWYQLNGKQPVCVTRA